MQVKPPWRWCYFPTPCAWRRAVSCVPHPCRQRSHYGERPVEEVVAMVADQSLPPAPHQLVKEDIP